MSGDRDSEIAAVVFSEAKAKGLLTRLINEHTGNEQDLTNVCSFLRGIFLFSFFYCINFPSTIFLFYTYYCLKVLGMNWLGRTPRCTKWCMDLQCLMAKLLHLICIFSIIILLLLHSTESNSIRFDSIRFDSIRIDSIQFDFCLFFE